jgi:hypothetical protein
MLDAPLLLSLVAPFLSLRDLWHLRSVNRHCFASLPNYTTQLSAEKVQDATALARVIEYFPHTRDTTLQRVTAPMQPLTHALGQFDQWKLVSLELSEVWNLTDASVRLVTEKCGATLERLTLRQCFLLKCPAIRGGPKLKVVTVANCLVTQFHDDTTWPALEELHVSSRVLTTLNARHLHKHLLASSQIRLLDLSDCFMVEQLLIDPGELPLLHTLFLRSCLGMKRLHVASSSLETLDLTLCGAMEVVVLELHRAKRLDLSFLQHLTHLLVRSESLASLNLRACSELTRENVRIECPSVGAAYVEGTKLRLDDLRLSSADAPM